jgi:hypothetical protein
MSAFTGDKSAALDGHFVAMAQTVGRRAVEWLGLEHSRALEDDVFWAPIGDAALKSAYDICLLLWCRAVLLGSPLDDYFQPLSATVLRIVSSPLYVKTLHAHARAVHLYGLPYAAARALGSDNNVARTALTEIVASGAPVFVERRPYEQLALMHFLESVELPAAADLDVAAIAATTLLAQQPNPGKLLPADAYTIAHTVFYLTDFGRRPLGGLRQTAETTCDIVQKLLDRFQSSDDADLTAELAVALACLGPLPRPSVFGALDYLRSLQRPDGTISQGRELASLRPGSSFHARQTWWLQQCHTAVVTALLVTVVESRLS